MKTAPLRQVLMSLTAGVTGAVFVFAGTTTAASSQGIQISPPTATYAGNKGATQSGTIKVTNLNNTAIPVTIGKEDFAAKGEEGEIELSGNADPLYSLAPWFTLDATQLTVPELGTKEVHYTIGIPPNAEPGSRYGAITFSTVPPKIPSGQSGASVQQTIAGIVFLRINGQAKEQLSVATFQTGHLGAKNVWSPATWFTRGPVDFLARIKNDGNVHEKPTGTITIKNLLGMKVATVPLDEHYVIPGAVRRLHNSWPTSAKKPLLLGPYQATLNATYANGQTLSASTSFTVVPWAAVIILILILILLLLLWRARKRFGRAFRILAGRE
jgi:hypothetical protein